LRRPIDCEYIVENFISTAIEMGLTGH